MEKSRFLDEMEIFFQNLTIESWCPKMSAEILSLVPWKALKVSQGSFADALILLEAFKINFVFRQKIDFFPRGKSIVYGQK